MTENLGTSALAIAVIILAPCRMMPCRSTAAPTMNPGTSCRKISGTLKASHMVMNRAALSAESTKIAPLRTCGWLATMPTTWPSSRARPTTISSAQRGLISKNEPASTSPSMTSLTS